MKTTPGRQERILLVDDESAILRTFRYCPGDKGYSAAAASNAPQAEVLLRCQVFDLYFLGLRLGEDNGLDVLAQMRVRAPWMCAVIVTAYSAMNAVVDTMQTGMVDYLVKPCNPNQLRLAAAKQLEVHQLTARLEALEDEARRQGDGLESHSPTMAAALETTCQVVVTDADILILGESDPGKGEPTRAIHTWSRRAKKSQVTINCPSLTAELMEGELFGHSRGVFTGATESTLDRVSQADSDTLSLGEIGDFPLTLQPKLLRSIQDKGYERVGDPMTCRADARILVATSRDLGAVAVQGQSRGDLLYRLNAIVLNLPLLHERIEDVLGLVERFLARFVKNYGRPARDFSEAAREVIQQYPQPGNICELRNVIERANVICNQERADVDHLGFNAVQSASSALRIGEPLSLEDSEKVHTTAVMASSTAPNQAAGIPGIDASTLHRKRKQYGL